MPERACPSAEQLQAYAVGQLPDDASDEIAEHLDRCESCQACLTTLDNAEDTLVSRLKQSLPPDAIVGEPECQAALALACSLASGTPGAPVSEQHVPVRAGQQLGEYRLLEELGSGGMGRVYKALQTKLDRLVALKILPAARADDRRAITRFEREMKAIGRLEHPNIVRAYDAREIDGRPVLVMEYVDGMDLSKLVRDGGRIRMADACELIRQAAVGLQYVHENGLIHRDVKPSNLMLTPQGHVKLLDLGLARFHAAPLSSDELTGAGQPIGTADYIAPEQVSDSRAVDIRADIYSLGCTLYKLLTGHAPFAGSDCRGTFDKLTAHVNAPVPSIRECDATLPEGLTRLIDCLLAKSADDRPATPGEVAQSLEPFCAGSDLVQLAAQVAVDKQSRAWAADGESDLPPPIEKSPVFADSLPSATARGGWFWGLVGAAVLLAAAGGFALGLIITVRKNGEVTRVEVPTGSVVTVDRHGDVDVDLPESAHTDAAATQSAATVPDQKADSSSPGDGGERVRNRLILYIDAAGRLDFDGAGPYEITPLPRMSDEDTPEWCRSLLIKVLRDSIDHAFVMYHPNAPKDKVRSVCSVMRKTATENRYVGVRVITVVAGPRTDPYGAWLDFRIAAIRKADGNTGLTQDDLQRYVETVPRGAHFAGPRDAIGDFDWFGCWGAPPENTLSWAGGKERYVLLSTEPAAVMLAADQGDLAWRVKRAEAVKDSAANPAMFIELDEAGGRRLGELTESHMNQPLAILIKNRVAMVATIVGKMTNHVQITGQFDQEIIDWWVQSLNPPVPAAAE